LTPRRLYPSSFYNVAMGFPRTPRAGLTRREWTALVGASPLLAQVGSKNPPQAAPAPAPASATPAEAAAKAADEIHKVRQRLTDIEVPMNVEPAFHFSA
jgi:hypothetical protein